MDNGYIAFAVGEWIVVGVAIVICCTVWLTKQK